MGLFSKNQYKLAEKLLEIFSFNGKDIPVIPILLVIAIDRAIELSEMPSNDSDIDLILEKIPSSIPEVYFDYLNRVNPKNIANNKLSDDQMRIVAELIADLSLADNFSPKDLEKYLVMAEIKRQELIDSSLDPIKRLIDNGIIIERQYAGRTFIRFIQDPLSEYLAAFSYAQKCGKDYESWKDLYERIEKHEESARGFKQALEIVQYTFAEKFNWCPYIIRTN